MGFYDTAQVCLNGHVITDRYRSSPALRQDFCDRCGAETLIACPNCKIPIRGEYIVENVFVVTGEEPKPPVFCHTCGAAYPWAQNLQKWSKQKRRDHSDNKQTQKDDDITTTDRIIKKLKNQRPVAIVLVLTAAILGLGELLDVYDKTAALFRSSQSASPSTSYQCRYVLFANDQFANGLVTLDLDGAAIDVSDFDVGVMAVLKRYEDNSTLDLHIKASSVPTADSDIENTIPIFLNNSRFFNVVADRKGIATTSEITEDTFVRIAAALGIDPGECARYKAGVTWVRRSSFDSRPIYRRPR